MPRRAGIAYLNVDADSIDSTQRQPGFLNAIQISDDEMDAVRVVFWLISFCTQSIDFTAI